MRTNLLALGIMLAIIAIGADSKLQTGRLTQRQGPAEMQWPESWAEPISFTLLKGPYDSSWLDFENDRYRLCSSGCTQSRVNQQGRIRLHGEILTLMSDQGKQLAFRLRRIDGSWYLRDFNQIERRQNQVYAPRLHPQPDWLLANRSFGIDGLNLGMTYGEVKKVFPKATPQDSEQRVYCENSAGSQISIQLKNDKVATVQGGRLSQKGRALLNERSTRADVEALFGPLNWTITEGPGPHGTSAQAVYGRLLFKVYWLDGASTEDAQVFGIYLEG